MDNEVTIEDHVRRFADLLEEKADQVDSLLRNSGTHLDIMCEFGNQSGQYPISLEPELLATLSRFSVTLHLTWWMPERETDIEKAGSP